MPKEEREKFAVELRTKLATHRTVFAVDAWLFESHELGQPKQHASTQAKTVSAAALRMLLDYCENEWPMGFVEYCAAVFQSREPKPGETAFDTLPDVKERMNAERLGFGAIYGTETE